MDFVPKDTSMTCHGDFLMLCIYNARTVSTNADLHALLEAAGRVKYQVGGVGFVVHPSVVHLVDSHEIPSPRLAIF
ncbi:unnamed protein product [Strongylus vulgaris]|uniref:Uncharacterized protein n=1 Tax=Strongylus vulgaris TaxID=40348 RepID=A0A3P7LTB0_STRVU|nr:unnamed protein product [Strongylus vulgaris]